MKNLNVFVLLTLICAIITPYSKGEETKVKAPNNIIRVNINSPGNGPGDHWSDAYKHLQDALDAIELNPNKSQIWVAQGNYYPDKSSFNSNIHEDDPTASFRMISDIKIYGGFTGNETHLYQRDAEQNLTVLNGYIRTQTPSKNSYHVIHNVNVNEYAILDGFTITGGSAGDVALNTNKNGGAILNSNSSPKIYNCTFDNNFAFEDGGAIYNYDSYPDIYNCKFENNSVLGYGGAINYRTIGYSEHTFTIKDCVFNSNSARLGGAIHCYSPILIENCTFNSNEATSQGGAVSCTNGSDLINCVFSKNIAFRGGGIFTYMKKQPFSTKHYVNIINCTLFENEAPEGSELFVESHINLWEYDFLQVRNTIFYNEENDTQIGTFNDASDDIILDIKASCIRGGYPGSGNISADPEFIDASNQNFRLGINSPCRNSGLNDTELLSDIDIDGNERIVCGIVDMGAYEATSGCNRIYVNDDAIGNNDGTSWEDAYKDLQVALDEATSGTEIWVAEGTYKPITSNLSSAEYNEISRHFKNPPAPNSLSWYTFRLENGVALFGGFQGINSETSLDDRDIENNPTVLSGDIGIENYPDDNCFQVVNLFYSNALVDGFTIKNDNNQTLLKGIYFHNSSGSVSNCTLENCSRAIQVNYESMVYLNHCIIRNNTFGVNRKGAITSFESDVKINSSKFTNNSGYNSGAIWLENSNAEIYYSTFSNNTASNGVGGIHIVDSKAEIINNLFSFNQGGSMYGVGAIKNQNSITNINFCTFYQNEADYYGADINSISSRNENFTLSNSIFWNSSVMAGQHLSDEIEPTYCDISDGTYTNDGNFCEYPEFVNAYSGDFHLKSTVRHFTNSGNWDNSATICSPCINAGNPSLPSSEPDGSAIVNIGAYGNTEFSSFECSIKKLDHKESGEKVNSNENSINIYPNPVSNGVLFINFSLKKTSKVNIFVTDLLGKKIDLITDTDYSKGNNTITWYPNRNVFKGVFLIHVKTNNSCITRKIIIND